MNYFVILLVTSLSSLTVRGQCPFPGKSLVLYGERGYVISYSLTTNRVYIDYTVTSSAVTTCDGSSKAGPQVYIDFYKINSPCTCTVTASISGNLYIRAEKVTVSSCTTTIIVRDTRYTCPTERTLSPLNVIANQSVTVTASYEENYNYGTFHHCLGFYQSSDDVQVTCGSGSTTQTTTPEKTTVYITSTPMSSAEMTVSPTHQDNSSTVSNELRMGTEPAGNKLAQMDEASCLHLQIPLVLFVVIAAVSVIVNIYLFIKLRQRSDSKSQQEQNTSRRTNHTTYTELDVTNITTGHNQAYTELNTRNYARETVGGGNQTYTELDITNSARGTAREWNQYDSMSQSRNYMNIDTS